MSVYAMTCVYVEKHPNADKLDVYTFRNNGEKFTIVANDTNNYVLGDVAAIVLRGLLKDGTKVIPSLIRGVMSQGMALGKTKSKEGTDLSEEYLASGVFHKSWPDISLFYVIRKYINEYNIPQKVYKYKSKIKLDGTNAGIQVLSDGNVVAQSRTSIITVNDDNMGFARWVDSQKQYWTSLKSTDNITIFGEWAGAGIQKRCSISKIDKKVFCVFAVLVENESQTQKYVFDPEEIAKILGNKPSDVFILPWYGNEISIDFTSSESTQQSADVINKIVEDVEACDPWVKDTFGIEGLGEGVVMYPVTGDTYVDKEFYDTFVFKAKGEKHNVVKVKAPVTIDPEVVANTEAFVKLFVTENRLEQFSSKTGFDQKKIGEFIKLFIADVEKESKAELDASRLEWKDVSKAVSTAAKLWYLEKLKSAQ